MEEQPNNYLNEYSYEQLKNANEKAFNTIKEFVDEMNCILFSDIKKYIKEPYKLTSILDNIKFLSKYNYQKVEYCLKLSKNELINKDNGGTEIFRYYYDDVGKVIHSAIYYQELILKIKTKKMLSCLTLQGKEIRDKIRDDKRNKLKSLQEELFYLIDNDPTI